MAESSNTEQAMKILRPIGNALRSVVMYILGAFWRFFANLAKGAGKALGRHFSSFVEKVVPVLLGNTLIAALIIFSFYNASGFSFVHWVGHDIARMPLYQTVLQFIGRLFLWDFSVLEGSLVIAGGLVLAGVLFKVMSWLITSETFRNVLKKMRTFTVAILLLGFSFGTYALGGINVVQLVVMLLYFIAIALAYRVLFRDLGVAMAMVITAIWLAPFIALYSNGWIERIGITTVEVIITLVVGAASATNAFSRWYHNTQATTDSATAEIEERVEESEHDDHPHI